MDIRRSTYVKETNLHQSISSMQAPTDRLNVLTNNTDGSQNEGRHFKPKNERPRKGIYAAGDQDLPPCAYVGNSWKRRPYHSVSVPLQANRRGNVDSEASGLKGICQLKMA